ncbi:MAG: HAMP domain-containing histidine kinase [Anaerolineales bacterium]|nr:HAMP domain-containing histidine kinase [Anaerolineales bacterium]
MPTETILVVEDDMALLEGLRDILELSGYVVHTARNGLEALAQLDAHVPDLIVSDINMPRMDGYQFYDQVRAHPVWVRLPFIFLTAKGEKADVRRGKLLGADDYITKPFDEADLLVAVQAKLNRRAQLDAAQQRQIADLKRAILTTLNHEFRTPLTYITTYADILRDTQVSAEELKNFMRGIQVGSERLRRLVEDFIFLVELQTGEAAQTYEQRCAPLNDLALLLRVALERCRAKAEARGLQLEEALAEPLPVIRADREYLLDAVQRLLDNAIKFSRRSGGRVRLSARAGGRGVLVQVGDEGIGMPADELDRIFDVFHQVDRPKLEQQGSGSGLAIAQAIAQLHGGMLSAQSALGQGSTFTLELPADDSPAGGHGQADEQRRTPDG